MYKCKACKFYEADMRPESVGSPRMKPSTMGVCMVSDDDPQWKCIDCGHQW